MLLISWSRRVIDLCRIETAGCGVDLT